MKRAEMKGSHPLLKPALEAAALAALVCAVTAAVALVLGLSGQRIMTLYCVNLCAVLAFQVFSGNSGVVSFGHTAFMAVGAYAAALATNNLMWHPAVALVFATFIAGLFGLILGSAVARLSGPYLAGTTLALAVSLPSVIAEE